MLAERVESIREGIVDISPEIENTIGAQIGVIEPIIEQISIFIEERAVVSETDKGQITGINSVGAGLLLVLGVAVGVSDDSAAVKNVVDTNPVNVLDEATVVEHKVAGVVQPRTATDQAAVLVALPRPVEGVVVPTLLVSVASGDVRVEELVVVSN